MYALNPEQPQGFSYFHTYSTIPGGPAIYLHFGGPFLSGTATIVAYSQDTQMIFSKNIPQTYPPCKKRKISGVYATKDAVPYGYAYVQEEELQYYFTEGFSNFGGIPSGTTSAVILSSSLLHIL